MSLSDVYRERHYSPGYVYIAGSLSAGVMKIGTTINIHRQQKRLRNLEYGSISDWVLLYYVWVDEAGRIEHAARRRLRRYRILKRYKKDGSWQRGREIVQCTFSTALEALTAIVGTDEPSDWWRSIRWREYDTLKRAGDPTGDIRKYSVTLIPPLNEPGTFPTTFAE